MESSDFQKNNPNLWENPEIYDYAQKFQTYKLYSILCILLKSEAIFTFFVYWIRGLGLSSGTIGLPGHNTLSHVWLLKPFFSLIIDKLNIPISQNNDDLKRHTKIPKIVQYRPSDSYSLLGITNYRVVVLLLAEFVLAFCSVVIYLLYHIDYFHTVFTKIFIYLLALSLVCASSYAEGLFCRYARIKGENSYVKLVSLRLILSSTYGLTTILFLIFPAMFPDGTLGKFLQINYLFPVFLVLNSIFVAVMASKHFVPPQLQNFQDRWSISPTASPVQMTAGSDPVANDFSINLMICLSTMLVSSMMFKNDFYIKYNNAVSKKYLYILITQSVKGISLGIFILPAILIFVSDEKIRLLYDYMAKLGAYQILVVGFFLSLIHQFLITYAILLALFIAVKGYEAWTLSLPTFGAHLTYLCLRQGVIGHLELSGNQSNYLKVIFVFFLAYCFLVLWNVKNAGNLEESNTETPNSGSESMEKKYHYLLPKSFYDTQMPVEVKSIWEQQSDFSYDSEVL